MLSTPRRKHRCSALAVSSMLLLAACGGGDSNGGATAAAPPPAVPSPPQQPAPPPPSPPAPPSQPNPPAPEVVLADTYTELVAGTINSPRGWPAWTAPPTRDPVSGIGCLNTIRYHVHALLSIYKDGMRQGLPDNVGRGTACTYELHTHDVTGVLHIESDVPRQFTLGQFFALWRQPLAAAGTAGLAGPVRVYLIENERLTLHGRSGADRAGGRPRDRPHQRYFAAGAAEVSLAGGPVSVVGSAGGAPAPP